MTDLIRFRCEACNAKVAAKKSVSGLSRKCPGCRHRFVVPMQFDELPSPMPDHEVSEYLRQSAAVFEVTKWNCELSRRLGDRDVFRARKKDGRRAINILHTFVWQIATSQHETSRFLDEMLVATGLSRVAAAGQLGTDRKLQRQYRKWMKRQSDTQHFELFSGALLSLRQHLQGIRHLRFDDNEKCE